MFKKRKKLKIVVLVFTILATIGGVVANVYVKKHGYRNLWHFISNYSANKTKAYSAKVEVLEIKIDKDDLQQLKDIRERAIKRGVLMDEGLGFIDVKLNHKGKKIKAKLRLKGHMTDHLQDKKWSFRIKTKGGDAFMGMKVFSLQHPGTRNYIYEWVYHQMMKQEGIIALNYDFIRVKLNDEDWGIYAVEEHFAQELIQENQRPKGPIVRFNPDMYWDHRIAELNEQLVDQPNADFMAANVDAYDDKNTFSDSTVLNGYKQATTLLESFRSGKTTTAQTFDVQKLAKFHAIIDVVGGHFSLDWSDVKYYYNAITHKLEPVAYESFSVTPTYSLCGSYKYIQDSTREHTFHEILFSDSVYYTAYTKALKQVATKKWVNAFFTRNKKALESKLGVLYKDFAYKDFDFAMYTQNVSRIQQLLNHGALVHAYVNRFTNKNIALNIGAIDAFPVKIVAVKIEGITVSNPSVIIPSRAMQAPVNYIEHTFVFNKSIHDSAIQASTKIEIVYEILGSGQQKTIDAIPVEMEQQNQAQLLAYDEIEAEKNLTKHSFLKIDKASATITIQKGVYVVSQTLVIPSKYMVQIQAGTRLNMILGSGIVSYADVYAYGTDDDPIVFTSTDSSGKGLSILYGKKQSVLQHCIFEKLGAAKNKGDKGNALLVYESPIVLNHVVFSNARANAVTAIRCKKVQFSNCIAASSKNDAFALLYSNATLTNCKAINGKDDGFVCTGSKIVLIQCMVQHTKGVAVLGKAYADIIVANSRIEKCSVAIEAVDGTQMVFRKSHMENCKLGMKAHKKGDVFGPARITLRNASHAKIKTLKEVEKGSAIVEHE